MANQLIPYQEVEQFGKAMVASGFFQDAKSISQAIVKIQAGAEIGLPPFASMTGVHIIKGKPVLGANLIATLIKNDSRYDYRVTTHTDSECAITFFENGEEVGVSSFTVDDATKAGINNNNWQKYPRNMLFARAISNGAKWYTPGIFGGMPVYTPDEFDLAVDEDGDVVEGQVVASPAPPKPQPAPQPEASPPFLTEEQEAKKDEFTQALQTADSITVRLVCNYAVGMAVGYKAEAHALNALKSVKGKDALSYDDAIDNETAVKMFTFLIDRKLAE